MYRLSMLLLFSLSHFAFASDARMVPLTGKNEAKAFTGSSILKMDESSESEIRRRKIAQSEELQNEQSGFVAANQKESAVGSNNCIGCGKTLRYAVLAATIVVANAIEASATEMDESGDASAGTLLVNPWVAQRNINSCCDCCSNCSLL